MRLTANGVVLGLHVCLQAMTQQMGLLTLPSIHATSIAPGCNAIKCVHLLLLPSCMLCVHLWAAAGLASTAKC